MKKLTSLGASVIHHAGGIYYVYGIINIPVQIVVTKQLDGEKHSALKILTENAEENEIRTFIEATGHFRKPGEKNNANAILQISVSANRELYDRIRRDWMVCDALRDLMKEEIAEWEQAAQKRGLEQGLERGLEQGLERGLEQGLEKSLISLICKKSKKGNTPEEIADILEEDITRIRQIYNIAQKYAPDYDEEAVFRELYPA